MRSELLWNLQNLNVSFNFTGRKLLSDANYIVGTSVHLQGIKLRINCKIVYIMLGKSKDKSREEQ